MGDPGQASAAEVVALSFVACINAGNVDGIIALMTDDYEFIDTAGDAYRGRDVMRSRWSSYFGLFPDYQIVVDDLWVTESAATMLGRSTGTLSEASRETLRRPDGSLPLDDELQGPAIWTARVQNGHVAQWRVHDDSPDTRAVLGIAR